MIPTIFEDKIEFLMRCFDLDTPLTVSQATAIWDSYQDRLNSVTELKTQTLEHRAYVDSCLLTSILDLEERSETHDHSKLNLEALELLKRCLDGTGDWNEWNDYHFSLEDHHPEHFDNVSDMSLETLLEMCADGASAYYQRVYLVSGELTSFDDQKDYYINKKGFSAELAIILAHQFMKYFNQLIAAGE